MIAALANDPAFSLVFDPHDEPSKARWCLELAERDNRHVVVRVSPDTRGLHWLGADVLEALGKRVDISAWSTTANETWFRACAWVVGEDTREIVVLRAHLLDRFRWERLIELAAIAQARLWLVVHQTHLTRGQREAVRDWNACQLTFPDFRRRFPRGPEPTAQATAQARFPSVPDDEYPTFLSRCRAVLSPDEAAQVAQVYWSAFDTVLEALGGNQASDSQAVVELLSDQLECSDQLYEMLTRARGAQAGAFRCGWLVKLNAKALAGAFSATPVTPLDEAAAAAVRQYSHPRYAAAAVIAMAARMPASAIVELNLGDVASDGTHVTCSSRRVLIPNYAAGVLRAQRAYRLAETAAADDPLFVAEKREPSGRRGRQFGRLTPHGLHQQLTKAALDTGLSLLCAEHYGAPLKKRWLRRQGITIRPLSPR